MLDQSLLTWQAYSHINYHRSFHWYVLAGAIILTLVIIGLITDNPLMSVAFLVLAGVYIISHQEEPKLINYKLTTLGFYINDKFYAYTDINYFYIVYAPPHISLLVISFKQNFHQERNIQINNIDPADIRELLLNREVLELAGKQESFLNVFARILKL